MHAGLKILLGGLLIASPASQASWTLAQEATCHLIPPKATWTITVTGGALSDPTLEINRGDKVSWLVLDQSVTIAFQEEGTSVFLTCASPAPLELGDGGTYLSGVILPGGKVSLCFIEPGRYEYVVSPWPGVEGTDHHLAVRTGTIVVK